MRMRSVMVKRLGSLLILLLITCCGCGGTAPRQYYEKSGGFSYNPPEAWQIVEFPGLKYRISNGPIQNGFAPNINVVDENNSGPLADYADASMGLLKKLVTNVKILKHEDFQTEDHQAGIRVITENEQNGRLLRQTFYFFSQGSRKYVVTCTATADGGEALDDVFKKSMKTFQIH